MARSTTIESIKRCFRQYNCRIEHSGPRIYLYIPGYDQMPQKSKDNVTAEIDAMCLLEKLYWVDIENGDEWCWTFEEME